VKMMAGGFKSLSTRTERRSNYLPRKIDVFLVLDYDVGESFISRNYLLAS
jgi:hypothetical protein